MRISDWSSDVCSSDLLTGVGPVTYVLVAGGLAIIYLFPRLTKTIPSPLVEIVVLTLVTVYGHIDVNTVGEMGQMPTSLPSLLIPHTPMTFETLRIIAPYSMTMAAFGLLESMLTAQIIEDFTDTPSKKAHQMRGDRQ